MIIDSYEGKTMKIIIAGVGKVGSVLTRQLSLEGNDLTIIDTNPDALEQTIEHSDAMSIEGNCASMEVLRNAGIENADLLITSTGEDEVNLLCCMTAHGMNPGLHTIARIRKPEYVESSYAMRKQLALSLVVNPEFQTAREIDRLLRYPGFLKRDKFANGRVELVELRIEDCNPLCNQPLYQMSNIVHCQVLVCTVVRDGKAVTPTGDFVLRAGDRIYVTASAQNLSILLKHLNITTKKIKHVIIAGGGKVAYYLTQMLIREGISVKIIERNFERCEELAEKLPKALVVQGDVSTQDVMEREDIVNCDALIALTGLDELNVILGIYANHFHVPQVITKMGRAANISILNQLPVGSIVCPKDLSCNTITRYVRAMKNKSGAAVTVHSIADGQAEAIEFIVDRETKYCGVPLKEISLKKNVLMASITRSRGIDFPNGESTFDVGDRIVVVTSGDTIIQTLNDIFDD